MTAVLPDTHTVRPPTKDDAEAVFGLVSAYNTAVLGFADYTLDDMVDQLTDPGFEPATDGWLERISSAFPIESWSTLDLKSG